MAADSRTHCICQGGYQGRHPPPPPCPHTAAARLHLPAPRQYHQLEGREQELQDLIEREYARALAQHAAAAVDERAETHLQVAALVLASHKALLPFLRDEAEVLQVRSRRAAPTGLPSLKTAPRLSGVSSARRFLRCGVLHQALPRPATTPLKRLPWVPCRRS
jgi:hypothetical protein